MSNNYIGKYRREPSLPGHFTRYSEMPVNSTGLEMNSQAQQERAEAVRDIFPDYYYLQKRYKKFSILWVSPGHEWVLDWVENGGVPPFQSFIDLCFGVHNDDPPPYEVIVFRKTDNFVLRKKIFSEMHEVQQELQYIVKWFGKYANLEKIK
jgi:hypothetical protein